MRTDLTLLECAAPVLAIAFDDETPAYLELQRLHT